MEMWFTVGFFISDFNFYGDVFLEGCWVRRAFKTEQLVTEYVWMWGFLFLMGILYTTMFALMRGWFLVDNTSSHWYNNWMPKHGDGEPVEETQEEKDSKAIANLLLL
jgi:hypothetical protein